ncbi:MAG TPA: hypothetical protein VG826_13815 [Pirellulales bacterium]|nr:hypothetical protein [Pirellulales bacterium]
MREALDEPLHIPKLDLFLWLFLVTVCGAAVYGSVEASKGFVKKYDSNVKKIAAAEKSVAKIAKADGATLRPNAALIKDVNARREDMNKQLLQLWQALYDRQAKFLVWPKESGIALGAEQGKPAGEAKKKSQTKAKKKKGDGIPEETRKLYNDSVLPSEFERIFSKLDLRRPKAGPAPSLENLPFKDLPPDFDGIVAWDPKQRETIISRHHLAEGTPSTARVKLVQEDLWIFESLIDVLAALNQNAKDPLSAPLKQIDTLDVAQWATAACLQQPPALWVPDDPAAAKPASPYKPPAGPGADATDEALLEGRYLDQKGQPLGAGARQPYAEFKQIFVYVKLVLDQRRFSDLLTLLANASLPVEVRHVAVQVLPDSTVREVAIAKEDGGAATAPIASPISASQIGNASVAETTAWDATVEIGGVIYLYNQPDIKKLGSGAAKPQAARTFRIPSPAN